MKITKKVLLGLFVLGLFLFAFSFTGKTVKAWYVINTSSEISVVGASIRTTGNSGLRFVGHIGNYDTSEVKGYGIAIAYGEATNFEVGGQANGKDVLSALDTAGLDKDGNFYVVIFGIPEDQYTQDVSARAYVVLNNDTIIYGTTVTTRNISEVVVKAHDDEVEGEFIDTIYNKIDRVSITVNDYNIITSNSVNKFVKSSFATGKTYVLFEKPNATMDEFVFVNSSNAFSNISDANTALVDNDKLYLFNGTYSLNGSITKKVTIMGPNYGVKGVNHTQTEAIVDFNAVAVNTNSLTIDGIKIYDTGTYKANNNSFVVAANTKDVVFKNCYFYSLANIMRYTKVGTASTVNGGTYTIQDCLLEDLSQFVIFAQDSYASKLNEVTIIGNTFKGSNTGYMAGYGMFRIQNGNNTITKVINNEFLVPAMNEAFFRCQNGTFEVKFNVFKNITNFNDGNSTNDITYDCNLYLNSTDTVLTTLPTGVSANHGVNDTYICTSRADLAATYQAYINNEQLTMSFETNGGTAIVDKSFVKGLPYTLPIPVKTGNAFLGWTFTNNEEDTNYVTSTDIKSLTANVTLYAKWINKTTNVNVSNDDTALLNTFNPDIIVNPTFDAGKFILVNNGLTINDTYNYGTNAFATITEALNACAEAGKKIYVFSGTYNETPIVKYGATITTSGKANVSITGTTTVNGGVSNVTFDNITFKNRIMMSGNISNFVMTNCDINSTVNTDGTIYFTGTAQNIRFENCTGTAKAPRFIYFAQATTNLTLNNNVFNGTYTLGTDNKHSGGVCDMIRCYTTLGGTVNIVNNTFNGAAQDLIYVTQIKPGTFTIKNNNFVDFHRAAIDFRDPASPTSTSVYSFVIEHNTFKDADSGWGCIRVRCAGVTSGNFSVTVHYNIFENLDSYDCIVERAGGTLTGFANCDYNYFDSEFTDDSFDAGTSSHANWFATKEALEAAYVSYLGQ